MSAEELEARISKISADIDFQKEILRQLERSKSAAQRALNALRDPVGRLPLEIASEIFIHARPPRPVMGAKYVPMLLLNICNAWTAIALSAPALWDTISVGFPRPNGFEALWEVWMQRARSRPLSIVLQGRFDDGVAAAVGRHASQLGKLEIYVNGNGFGRSGGIGAIPLGPLPILRRLRIGSENTAHDMGLRDHHFLLEVLRCAPNLAECTLENISPMAQGVPREQISLPALRRLQLGRWDYSVYSDDAILESLTLPGLRTLLIQNNRTSCSYLLSFLRRSAPPLETLGMMNVNRFPFVEVDECLRLVPTVAQFKISHPTVSFLKAFFTALTDSFAPLLPDLHSLTIYHYPSSSIQTWKPLLDALLIRRAQIKRVNITAASSELVELNRAAINASFRELAVGGMEIHIGTLNHELYGFMSA